MAEYNTIDTIKNPFINIKESIKNGSTITDSTKLLTIAYNKPTPKVWSRIGDGILLLGSITSAITLVIKNPYITCTSIILTAIGKYIANLATK